MRASGSGPNAQRLRALVVLLWRAGLRISEALALTESDLDPTRGSILVRSGKGGRSAWTAGPGSNYGHGLRSAENYPSERSSA